MVEAVEVVGQTDRVSRHRLRAAPGRRLGDDVRELGELLDQLLLLGRQLGRRLAADDGARPRLAEQATGAGVHVLHVVDGVLARLLGGQVDVDLERLVGAALDQVPARRVHADLVEQVVEEDDIAGALAHARLLAAAQQVDELVDQHLDPVGVAADHRADRLQPGDVAVMVGTEHVDRAVEVAQLVVHVGDVGGEVGRLAAGAQHDAVLVVAVGGGAHPGGAVLDEGVDRLQGLGDLLLDHRLLLPRVDVDAEARERCLDRLQHVRHGVAVELRQVVDVLADVAVLRGRLAATARVDRQAELLHLPARVVEVVLLDDVVAGEAQEARHRVAVGAVAGRADRQRAGGIGRDELDLDALRRAGGRGGAGAEVAAGRADLGGGLGVPGRRQEQVDEARPGDLDPLDGGQRRSDRGDLLRHLARVALRAPGQLQSSVRCEVAVLGVVGAGEPDLGADGRGESRGEALDARQRRPRAGRTAPRASPCPASTLLRP